MSQQISPFIEGKFGWNYGESGWNSGMDENMLKFSFMFDGNVDGVVHSLPAAVNGQSYFLTADNRLYFAVKNTWYSTPTPKWFQFKIKTTGEVYQFDGTSATKISSNKELDTRLESVELTVSGLGSAAFVSVESMATQGDLDIVSAQANTYTDMVAAKPLQDYSELRLYTDNAPFVRITSDGLAGIFKYNPLDTSTQDNGGTIIVDSLGRRWQRVYNRGVVHVDWFGATPTPGVDNRAAILAAHNYCASSTQDRRLLFSAGKYEIHSTLTIRGLVHWQGSSDGGAGTIIEWMGQDDVAISCDAGDWFGNYQGTFESLGVYQGVGASKAYAFDLIRCSEFMFDKVYANSMKAVFRFRGTAICYFHKIVSAYCDDVFEYAESTGIWANAMHVFSDCNFWETPGSIFKFTSGEAYSIFMRDTWAERFQQFIGDGHGDSLGLSVLGIHVTDSHLLSVDATNPRIIYFVAKPGDVPVSISRVTFTNVRGALANTDYICYASKGSNTSVSTFLFGDTSFENCHMYGASFSLFGADVSGPSVRVSGDTIAQQGYFTGSPLPYALGSARVAETNKPQYYAPTWGSTGATQPSVGNGALYATYTIRGGETRGRITLQFGTTTTAGDGAWSFSIPAGALNQFARITGTATILIPGVEQQVASVTGVVSDAAFNIVLAKNGIIAPVGLTLSATTEVVIEFSYDNEPV